MTQDLWHHDPDTGLSVRGYAFDPDGRCHEGGALLAYLSRVFRDRSSAIDWLRQANGCFAWHWQPPHQAWSLAAVDRIRSIPLFYRGSEVRTSVPLEADAWDAAQLAVFPYAAHTLGPYTLHRDWRQLQAGEYLVAQGDTPQVAAYFRPLNRAPHHGEDDLWAAAEITFRRLIASAEGSPLVVPLSGGYDSRFIVTMLKHLSYEPVICFTYGRAGNFEAQISQQVAAQLGYAWHFVPYPEEVLGRYLGEAGLAYQDWAAAGVSLAHEQDWMAVQELKQQGVLPADSIFVPGFGGDVLAGSWRPGVDLQEPADVRRYLGQSTKFFAGKRVRNLEEAPLDRLIGEELAGIEVHDFASAYAAIQYWGLRNRMGKFLVNAVRVYEDHGYRWRLPFFDRDWMDAWLATDEQHKVGKRLYLRLLRQRLFQPLGVDIDAPAAGGSPWRKALKPFLPPTLIDQLKAWFSNPHQLDPTNAQPLARLFCRAHGWPEVLVYTHSLNYLMATSYLWRHNPRYPLPWKDRS